MFLPSKNSENTKYLLGNFGMQDIMTGIKICFFFLNTKSLTHSIQLSVEQLDLLVIRHF